MDVSSEEVEATQLATQSDEGTQSVQETLGQATAILAALPTAPAAAGAALAAGAASLFGRAATGGANARVAPYPAADI